MRRVCVGIILLFIFVVPGSVSAQTNPGLRTQGNIIVKPDGTRFIINGVNVEAYRDYDGCPSITDGLWTNDNLNKMITSMKNQNTHGGLNAVRLNFDSKFINQSPYQNLTKYLDIAQTFTNAGIYVMIADHSLDGILYSSSNPDYALATSTWKAVIDGFRARGMDKYLFLDPVNEISQYNTRTDMINANEFVLNYLRKTANYTGLVLLSIYWNNNQIDTQSYDPLLAYDATLLGGHSNIAFDTHWYPPYWPVSTYVANSFVTAKTYPLVIGEMGWDLGYPGQDTPNPQYVTDLLNLLLSTGIPNGHNGVFPWIWKWCDNNTLTNPSSDYATLSDHGNLYKSFWASVNADVTPTPSPVPGDLNGDTHVNIFDYNILVANFGRPYTIFDYNILVANFGT